MNDIHHFLIHNPWAGAMISITAGLLPAISWVEPFFQFVAVLIGCAVGVVTLFEKVKHIRKKKTINDTGSDEITIP